jgi:hypothetical protein
VIAQFIQKVSTAIWLWGFNPFMALMKYLELEKGFTTADSLHFKSKMRA